MHINLLCACWHLEAMKGLSSLTSCRLLILSRLSSSLIWAQLTLLVPTWGTRSPSLQDGAPIHRVRAHSLIWIRNRTKGTGKPQGTPTPPKNLLPTRQQEFWGAKGSTNTSQAICAEITVCCAPSMQPPQRMHIASVKKQCSGYELVVIVMNLLYTLPLTSHHNNKDVHKGATL
jgi:hypothetical protein